MDIFSIYILTFLLFFLVMPIVFFILRVILWLICDFCGFGSERNSQRHNNADRQGNNHSQPSETSRSNRYNDIFFIEANGQEAARIRAQLEKDDKDLPSYDEVMRIANLSHPTAAPTPVADNLITATPPCVLSINGSSSSVNTSETTLAAPAYIESATSLRPLTPPPYTPEPIGATVVLPITTPLHAQPNTHSS